MSKYIDAEKLYKSEIERCGCVPLVGSCSKDNKSLRDVLGEQPTADVVEVVRCKDCKYCKPYKTKSGKLDWNECLCTETIVEFSHFCSYGERREG